MSVAKNPRAYFALILLLVSAIVVVLREHRPSFLRPNLHMYAYVSSAEGTLTVIDLAKLQAINKLTLGLATQAGAAISDLREHAARAEIWGASTAGNCVFVVDTRSNEITLVPVGSNPLSIDFSPDGNRVYTTTSNPDQLVAIDTPSRQIYGRAHTLAEPVQARITPDAKNIVVINRRANALSVHDARTLQFLSSIPVIPQPDEVIVTPDSSLAFVMSRTQTRLSVVDLTRSVLVTNLELAGTPTQLLLKPDGGELYVISPDAHGLQVINTWTHEVADTMLLGSAPASAVLSNDAGRMYVADRAAGRVTPVDILNRRVAKPIVVGASPSAMRFAPPDPDEKPSMLLVIDESSDDLAVLRTRTDSLITLIPVGARPQRLALKTF